MAVRIEKNKSVWTIIHDRPEARNAMDPDSADALTAAFLEFDAAEDASVAVFYGAGGSFCAGWDLKYASSLDGHHPLGELDIPTARTAAMAATFHADRWDRHASNWTSPSSERSKDPLSQAEWSSDCGAIFESMAEDAYFGVYCRRWGIPLIDGGTFRLPRLVGQGRALEIILTGRKVPADECLKIGLCEYVTPRGGAREKAETLAHEIARFPQVCARTDRRSAIKSHGLSVREALIQEWYNGRELLSAGGIAGAGRFKDGLGRHGDFGRTKRSSHAINCADAYLSSQRGSRFSMKAQMPSLASRAIMFSVMTFAA